MRNTSVVAWIAALLALVATPGCGDDSTTVDAGDDHGETLDDAGDTDEPPEAEADTPLDVPADVEPDLPADVEPDLPADVEPDLPADIEPDLPPDVVSDLPPDVPADEGPEGDVPAGELRVTMTSSNAWANLMPGGSSSHAIFTLQVVNGGSAAVTGFTGIDGEVSLASDGATVFAFTAPTLTRSGGGAFDGTIAAGATVTLDGNGTSRTASGGHCDADVKVAVHVTWTGGPANLELVGDTISLMCVY